MRALLLVALLSQTAYAGEITWEAPAECPGGDEVRGMVEAHLGRAADADARLVVERAGRRWRVVMTMAEGERTLEARSCRDLAESAALILAMAIEEAVPPEAEPEPEPEIEIAELAPPEVEGATDDETPPLPDLRREYRDVSYREPSPPVDIGLRVRALVGGDLGTLPSPATAYGGAIEVSFDAWSADVGALQYRDQQALKPGMPMQGADVGLTTIAARGCYTGGPRRWRAGGCVGGDVAFMRAAGFGFTDPAPRTQTYGGGPQFGAVYALRVVGPVAVRADVAATYLVVRPVLVDGDGMVVHDPNLLVWRGFVGVEASWE